MISLTAVYLVLVVGLALWAWWPLAGSRWPAATLSALAAIYGGLYLAGTELLARPKPIGMELFARGSGDAEILATAVDPGNAVYMWLLLPGGTEPRAYVLPWSDRAMEAVQRVRDEAERTGQNMRLEWSEEAALAAEGELMPERGGGPKQDDDLLGIWRPLEDSYSDWTGMIHPWPQPRDPFKPRAAP